MKRLRVHILPEQNFWDEVFCKEMLKHLLKMKSLVLVLCNSQMHLHFKVSH